MVKTSVCSETPITQKTIQPTRNINQFTRFCITRDPPKFISKQTVIIIMG